MLLFCVETNVKQTIFREMSQMLVRWLLHNESAICENDLEFYSDSVDTIQIIRVLQTHLRA